MAARAALATRLRRLAAGERVNDLDTRDAYQPSMARRLDAPQMYERARRLVIDHVEPGEAQSVSQTIPLDSSQMMGGEFTANARLEMLAAA